MCLSKKFPISAVTTEAFRKLQGDEDEKVGSREGTASPADRTPIFA